MLPSLQRGLEGLRFRTRVTDSSFARGELCCETEGLPTSETTALLRGFGSLIRLALLPEWNQKNGQDSKKYENQKAS
jgi:hypothetical protein